MFTLSKAIAMFYVQFAVIKQVTVRFYIVYSIYKGRSESKDRLVIKK
jgi:hypothetical protein